MIEEDNQNDFLDQVFASNHKLRLIDVRSPSEYAKGHIIGAYNIPLLDDEGRAEIGTLFKKDSPSSAFMRGLDLVGPRMSHFVAAANEYLGDEKGVVYCWRGGKRSNSMSWLFNMSGMTTKTIPGGYKAYRTRVQNMLAKHPVRLLVLGGKTGAGKTLLLHKMRDKGEQIIDLEGLANHKGSAFGWIGEEAQPAVEQFENLLAQDIYNLDPEKVVWIENESRMIGRIPIFQKFWDRLKSSPLVNIEIPTGSRVKHLSRIYNAKNVDDLREAFTKIQKRLGGLNIQKAMEALDNNDLEKAAEIALLYYDKSYTKLLEKNEADPIYRLNFDHGDFDKIADELITFKEQIKVDAQ